MLRLKQHKKIRSLSCILPALLAWLAVSCGSGSEDTPVFPTPEEDGISVSIVLAGQGTGYSGSRATEPTDEAGEYGSVAENYIDYKNLYVMTFSIAEGKKTLSNDSELLDVMWDGTENDNATIFSNGEDVKLTAKLSENEVYKNGEDFCIVALANLNSFKGGSFKKEDLIKGVKFGDLKNKLIYKYDNTALGTTVSTVDGITNWSWKPDNADKSKRRGIPMFGVKTVNLKGYDSKTYNEWNPFILKSSVDNSTTLWLLRSLAKVTIEFSEKFLSEDIPAGEKVELKFLSGGGIGNGYTGNFNVIPDIDRMKDFSDNLETGFITKIPSENEMSKFVKPNNNLNLAFNASTDGRYAYMYLPEYEFVADALPEFTVLISIGGGVQEFKFEFKEYPDGEPTRADSPVWKCVLRNHSYHYRIGLDFRVISVIPSSWGDVFDNEFNFG